PFDCPHSVPLFLLFRPGRLPAFFASNAVSLATSSRVFFHSSPRNFERGSSRPSGYFIICQNPSRLAYRLPRNSNGVAAKFESSPSSFRFDRITSPGFASCGSISQLGAPFVGAGSHHL